MTAQIAKIDTGTDKLIVWKDRDAVKFPWNWELRDKEGVYGSLSTQQEALEAGLAEWAVVYPGDSC